MSRHVQARGNNPNLSKVCCCCCLDIGERQQHRLDLLVTNLEKSWKAKTRVTAKQQADYDSLMERLYELQEQGPTEIDTGALAVCHACYQCQRANHRWRGLKSIGPPVRVQSPRVQVKLPDDNYRWRRYGPKPTEDDVPNRLSFNCISAGCPVTKFVDVHTGQLTVTYSGGEHNHDPPGLTKRARVAPKRFHDEYTDQTEEEEEQHVGWVSGSEQATGAASAGVSMRSGFEQDPEASASTQPPIKRQRATDPRRAVSVAMYYQDDQQQMTEHQQQMTEQEWSHVDGVTAAEVPELAPQTPPSHPNLTCFNQQAAVSSWPAPRPHPSILDLLPPEDDDLDEVEMWAVQTHLEQQQPAWS